MKKLKFKDPYNHHHEYTNDIDHIVKVFADRGYDISHQDAVRAWECVSESLCAGWLCLDSSDDDEVFRDAFLYFEEV
jgi:hypothetical protein